MCQRKNRPLLDRNTNERDASRSINSAKDAEQAREAGSEEVLEGDEIFDAQKGSKKGDELEILSILVDQYEKENFPIDLPDPIEAIKFRMEQMDLRNKDLAEVVGNKSRVSEVLNRKRKLSLDMIRKLNTYLRIPTEVLVQEY